MILEGYTFNADGRDYRLDMLKDFDELEKSWQYRDTVYFLKDDRVFVLNGYVIAKGDLGGIRDVEPPMFIDVYRKENLRKQMENWVEVLRGEALKEEVFTARPVEEIKKEMPSWFAETKTERSEVLEVERVESMGFKTADTNETILELKVPTGDELDSYFSSIGLRLPEVG